MPLPGQRPALAALCLAALAAAAPVDHAQEYRACIALASRDAGQAFEAALAWRDRGGGPPAEHCAAVALVHAGQFAEAAVRLEELARRLGPESQVPPDAVLGQAANAWLLAEQPAEALKALDAALLLAPGRPDLLVDQGRARAALDDFAGALAALDLAVQADAANAEAHAYRAAALRRLGRGREALDAAEAAVAAGPANTLAHLERGLVRRDLGDRKGAREDFLAVLRRGEGTPAGDAAQRYLEEMDVRVE